ncbi:MAG: SpoIIE family protein phosphatase, partial [Myxococcales bacterium]|nr:SpoIIE family protein phosphatase [Myxococcales bacterium]
LDDVRISRQHAKIASEPGAHVVYDLGSSNGTFVNDNPVKRHALAFGDLVRFGPFRFRFEADPLDAPSPTGRRASFHDEELTRVGFEAPTKIVGETNARVPRTLVHSGGLADLEEADRRLRTLFSFVQAIAATLDTNALFESIVSNLFDAFPTGALAAVYTLDEETKTMAARRVKSRDGTDVPHYPLPAELYLELVQGSKAVLSAPLALDFDEPTGQSSQALLMHAPLVYRGVVLGVLNVRCNPGSSFTQGDLDLLAALASQAALALQNARLHQESLAQQRLQRDLALAQQIQKSFLPVTVPDAPGLRFFAEYRPALAVGGDFYDVFWLSPPDDGSQGKIGCIIGDVSGKGVSAALLMARVSSDLRTALLTRGSPAAALEHTNRELVQRGQHDIFVTAVAMTIDVGARTISLSNAGHMPPYVRRRHGELTRIDAATSSPIGLLAEMPYAEVELSLAPGDAIMLMTDGVHEATNEQGHQLGFEGVELALRSGRTGVGLVEALLSAVRVHAGGGPPYDDLTLLLCAFTD